jgi:Protein of unknown function (DUF3795)
MLYTTRLSIRFKVMKEELIAPCGMNCGICLAHLRTKNTCPGCRSFSADKNAYYRRCIIINCEVIKTNTSGFCYECARYPCRRLKQLDKRYRAKYAMSMLENLESIRENGLPAFITAERARWRCAKCGGTVCVHRKACHDCGAPVGGNR